MEYDPDNNNYPVLLLFLNHGKMNPLIVNGGVKMW